MKKLIRERSDGLNLSLHDAHVKKIRLKKDRVEFGFDCIFDYSGSAVKAVKAKISFQNLEPENVTIYVLAEDYKKRTIKGKSYDLKSFLKKYKALDFEILTETYYVYDAVWEGFLNTNKGLKHCIMTIWNQGEMVYHIGKMVYQVEKLTEGE